MKNKIDIPTIFPNPPLPPKEYSKLLSYFKTSLAPAARASARVRGSAPVPPSSAPAGTSDTLDPTIDANLKAICARLNTPNAYAYACSGVRAVLAAPDNSTVRGEAIQALFVAVVLMVIERLSPRNEEITIGNSKWIRGTGYKAKQLEIVAALAEVAGTRGLQKCAVDDWVQKLSNEGFRKWTWMRDVPDGSGVQRRTDKEKNKEEAVEAKETKRRKRKAEEQPPQPEPKARKVKAGSSVKVPVTPTPARGTTTKKVATAPKAVKAIPKPKPKPRSSRDAGAGGGGKMLQDRVDYLTEKKKNSFQMWKLQILERCAEIEAL